SDLASSCRDLRNQAGWHLPCTASNKTLGEPNIQITVRITRLAQRATPNDDGDWEWFGSLEKATIDVESRWLQLLDPAVIRHSRDEVIVPGYVFHSADLVAIATLLYGNVRSDLDRFPSVPWTDNFPYRLQNGAICFICEDNTSLRGAVQTQHRCSLCPSLPLTIKPHRAYCNTCSTRSRGESSLLPMWILRGIGRFIMLMSPSPAARAETSSSSHSPLERSPPEGEVARIYSRFGRSDIPKLMVGLAKRPVVLTCRVCTAQGTSKSSTSLHHQLLPKLTNAVKAAFGGLHAVLEIFNGWLAAAHRQHTNILLPARWYIQSTILPYTYPS
ncbi:hypothetical protein PILCRDRAFT_93467, partial [Piloderma croceum F 1598]